MYVLNREMLLWVQRRTLDSQGNNDLGVLIGLGSNAGSFSWTHSTPADFQVPFDTVNSATITLRAFGVDDANDELAIEGRFVGTLQNSSWEWAGWWNWYLDDPTYNIASVFSSWESGSPLDLKINYNERGWLNGFYLYSSTFKLDYENSGNSPAPVPEPASMLLFGTGLIVFGFTGKKFKRKK
jgi:hypothetical protein